MVDPTAGTRRLCLVGALSILIALPASAGELRVLLEAEGGVRSDGNYAQVSRPEAAELESDNLARGGFNLKLSYDLPRLDLALGYSPAYEWVLDDTSVTGTSHRLNLGLTANLSRRLDLSVRERLMKSRGLDLYSPFTAPEETAVPRRGDLLTHALDVAFDQQLTRRMSLVLGAAHTLRTFDEDEPGLRPLRDTETLAARLGGAWEMAEDHRIEALAGLAFFDFGGAQAPIPGQTPRSETREADVRTLGIAYRRPLARDGQLRAEAGTFWIESLRRSPGDESEPLLETEDSDSGFRGGLEASWQREIWGWNLGYRHDISAGLGLGRATVADSAFAGVSANLGRRIILGLDGNYARHRDLDGDAGLPEDPDDFEEREPDTLTEFAAGTFRASWAFSQVARLTGGYSQVWQESRVAPYEDLSYPRYFLALAVRLYSTGETPEDPARQGETTDDEPDAQ